jgi:hypothetical protein
MTATTTPEITGQGDCYEVALDFTVFGVPAEERHRYRVAHGTPLGEGPIEGIRYGHAWIEHTAPIPERPDNVPFTDEEWEDLTRFTAVTVIDKSNGNDVVMPRSLYYALGCIDFESVRRYTFDEAGRHAVTTGVYGPWE